LVCQLLNGVLIFGTGLYELVYPPQDRVVLYALHAGIWWGGLLAILGAVYCYGFSPARERHRNSVINSTRTAGQGIRTNMSHKK